MYNAVCYLQLNKAYRNMMDDKCVCVFPLRYNGFSQILSKIFIGSLPNTNKFRKNNTEGVGKRLLGPFK